MALLILNILFVLFIPLLLTGAIKKVKSLWTGRKGPSIIQPFHDVIRLLKKGEVVSVTASYIFSLAPVISLAAVIAAALLVPLTGHKAMFSFNGDFIVFSYFLALSKFFTIIGGMDTGSSFEGMGCSREATFSTVAEPGFFIIIASLSYAVGYKSFSEILSALHAAGSFSFLLGLLTAAALFIFMLAEACRIPVDDPATHLELTMIHEVMALDNSGPDFAFILYGSSLKLFLFASVIANILIPSGLSSALAVLVFLSTIFAISAMVGLIESIIARLRMTHVPQLLFMAPAIGMIIFFIVIMGIKNIL